MFDDIWRKINKMPGPVVQEYHELEHVFNLLNGCKSYLEVGTAEGKSMYVLSHAMPDASLTSIDYCEDVIMERRRDVWHDLNREVQQIKGDTNTWSTYEQVKNQRYDAVFIDAGHKLLNVLIDACWYGPLADKYIIFHDITIPDVETVFEWYKKSMPNKRAYRVVNSETYGYGIIEV